MWGTTTIEHTEFFPPFLAPRGARRPDAVAAATVAPAAAAAAARAVRSCARAGAGGGGTAIPAVRAQVLRAPVQQPRLVRLGGRLRDRRRVRVSLPGGRQRARRTRPHRPLEERLPRRTLEHHGYGSNKLVALARRRALKVFMIFTFRAFANVDFPTIENWFVKRYKNLKSLYNVIYF